MVNRTRILITVLVLIIVVLAGIVVYSFLIKPQISGYVTNKQIEGANLVLTQIVNTVVQCQTFPLPIGNQTIHLVALECLQQPQAQQPAPVVQ